MSPLPPLKALQAFDALGRTGSVALAAADLGVTPGAISQQLRKLEEAVEARLVEHDGRGLRLTPLGTTYHAQIRQGFATFADAAATLREASADVIVLSCLTTVLGKWIGRRMRDWTALEATARVSLVGSDAEPDLAQGGVDMRIYYGGRRHPPHHAELFVDHVVPVCAPALIEGRHPSGPDDILRFPLLHIAWDPRFGANPGWAEWGRLIGAQPPAANLTYGLSGSAIDAALAGQGFVLGQIAFIGPELETGKLVVPFDLRLPLPEPYYLAWNPDSLRKTGARAFHRWLLGEGRAQGLVSAPPSRG
ncbi:MULTISPECIES: LysR substrate-binding domain-containing protein [Methylobacterium]|uniref:LysR substrate-binding domain-containing protein n=1 Tax=Methylobacterium TaxID=407 RepID=UPI0008EE4621|nr:MULTISPECIES: LysR substrate-binding domain-containing protein [Methylobacterium]MBZ6416309.1 LysR family transcriptional regulator [Methylobacterium sp.]MBK3397323.1 LysR family transcriptional regulator [Methylobacterium ajmalii]MBK3412682.1 LysR family transcriptional regulator [Methylobacterium ajmalii]MBK3421875.1 LysR family transcriptional regulator [Methylobacterium ajmalii]SFF36170.1 LysR family transcriptional regulator, glycine cleavage system transcriptional activator [Methyloba